MSLHKASVKGAATSLVGVALAVLAGPVAAQGLFGAPGAAQIEATRQQFPALKLELVLPKKQYALGEAIEVVMRYVNAEKVPFKVKLVSYDRSGRIFDFGFSARDVEKKPVRDPFVFRGGMMGGLSTSRGLAPGQSYEQTATVNEWLAFDKPGLYRLAAYSDIVSAPGDGKRVEERALALESAPLEIEITAPDEATRQQQLGLASRAVASAEEKQKTLPVTLQGYEREQKVGPEAAVALRTLRWMIDPRAISVLVRALELQGNAGFEAHRALVAFPDPAPVRAVLVARLKNGRPVLEGVWFFKDLLSRSSTASKPSPFGFGLTPEEEALFNLPLRASLSRSAQAHDVKAASRDASLLLQNDPKAPGEGAIWHQFWPGAASLSEEGQWTAALLLLQEKERAKSSLTKTYPNRTYPVALSDLQNAARDSRLGQQLRSAAVVALAARGDFTLRPLLALDVTAPQPHFTNAAYATLNDFERRAIAVKLLQSLYKPDDSSAFAKDEIAARLRNFGGGATNQELVAGARWMTTHFPYGQGPLLEAVALRAPPSALVLVRESLAKRPAWEYGDQRLGVLVRLQLPAARTQTRALLGQTSENFLVALLSQIESSASDTRQMSLFDEGERRLRAPRDMSESLVPEIARIYFSTPSLKVRQVAKNTLMEITELRTGTRDTDSAETAAWRLKLSRWWQQNAERLHRAGTSISPAA